MAIRIADLRAKPPSKKLRQPQWAAARYAGPLIRYWKDIEALWVASTLANGALRF